MLETDDGALIHMTFTGVRDDANQYFRTLPRFETAAPKYAFLNRCLQLAWAILALKGPFISSRNFSDVWRVSKGSTVNDAITRYFKLGCEVKALGRGHIQRLKESVRRHKRRS